MLFPYTAVNEDELTLSEGDIVTILSKEAPDRGWWRGELNGRVGLFPDNFVQALPPQGKIDLICSILTIVFRTALAAKQVEQGLFNY